MTPSQVVDALSITCRSPSERKHVCLTCQRKFNRREHLLRHERIHTEEMPFECEACGQRFKRQDVYRRHLARQCRANSRTPSRRRSRAPQACNLCRSLKLKCNGLAPCQRCLNKGRPCSYRPNVSDTLSSASAPDAMEEMEPRQPHAAPLNPPATPEDSATPIVENLPGPSTHDEGLVLEATGPQGIGGPDVSVGQGSFADAASATMSDHPPIHPLHEPSPWNPVAQDSSIGILPQDALNLSFDGTLWDVLHQDFYPYFLGIETDVSLEHDISFDHLGAMELPQHGDLLSADNSRAPVSGARSPYRGNVPMWLDSMPPTIQHHDPHIIDVFIEKFTNNISASFPTFQDVKVVEQTLPDLVLALAAVGGLFSDLSESFHSAMSLYTDARRLANGRVWSEEQLNSQQLLDLVRALLSIELFGLCSGDARSLECSEAFHRQLLQVVQDSGLLGRSHSISQEESDIKMRLLVSLHTLESYHVILLPKAPCIHANTYLTKARNSTGDGDPEDSSLSLLRTALNPHLTFSPPDTLIGSMFCLVSLACLTWHARPHRDRYQSSPSIWKRDHVELALHRWSNMTSLGDEAVGPSMKILFHMTLLNMYADMSLTHRIASSHLGESQANPKTQKDLEMWASSHDGQAALLQATSLLETAKKCLVFQDPLTAGQQAPGKETTHHAGVVVPESPHLAASIYSAALLLWITNQACGNSNAGVTQLESGVHSLSRLSSRMARRLCGNLVRLRSSTSHD